MKNLIENQDETKLEYIFSTDDSLPSMSRVVNITVW